MSDGIVVDSTQEYLKLSKFMGAANIELKLHLEPQENGTVRVRKIETNGDMSSWDVDTSLAPLKDKKEKDYMEYPF